MTEIAELLTKREELKHQLANGEYRTLVDVILDGIGRFIQRITRGTQPISTWYSTILIYLITLLVGLVAIVILNESALLRKVIEVVPFGFGVLVLIIGISATASMVIANIFIHNIFATFHESVLDVVESADTLKDIQHWLAIACNKKWFLVVSIPGGVIAALYVTLILKVTIGFAWGSGLTLLLILLSMQSAVFVLFLFATVILSIRIRRFQLKLFTGDPSSSEVIGRLSGVLSNFVYLVATYGAILTLVFVASGLTTSYFIIVLPFLWVPTTLIFAANHYGLASIIQRAKWKTLKVIQEQIEALQTGENLTDKDAMDAIMRLMDYHDRIKETRNSALDLRAGLNFLNSLLLPLLAFVLANLDKILALFQ